MWPSKENYTFALFITKVKSQSMKELKQDKKETEEPVFC